MLSCDLRQSPKWSLHLPNACRRWQPRQVSRTFHDPTAFGEVLSRRKKHRI